MEDLERDLATGRVGGKEDSSAPAPADLALDVILPSEGLAHQRQHVAPDGRVLEGDASMVTHRAQEAQAGPQKKLLAAI
jgi:hypothetical protein